MTNTYVPLATVTLTSTDSEIIFSSIPATYRDLIVVSSFTCSSSASGLNGRFNSDTGNNYSYVRMWGENSSGFSSAATDTRNYLGDIPTLGQVMNRWQIMDYSATDKHKTSLVLHAYAPTVSYNNFTTANRWANTNAINTITLFPTQGTFQSGSTFSLYGIAS